LGGSHFNTTLVQKCSQDPHLNQKMSAAAQVCHPATWEVEDGRTVVPGESRQKSSQDTITMEKRLRMVAGVCLPIDGEKHKIGGPQSRPACTESETLSSK
jgi:hypothetical protein